MNKQLYAVAIFAVNCRRSSYWFVRHFMPSHAWFLLCMSKGRFTQCIR